MGGVGIDYGRGLTNVDLRTGIRYGVIPENAVHWWDEGTSPSFPDPSCPYCGSERMLAAFEPRKGSKKRARLAALHMGEALYCQVCKHLVSEDDASPECDGSYVDKDGLQARCGEDGDIFVTLSPYFARAAFCSPCAPGACHLLSEHDAGERAYCLGHDWFDGGAPYRVFSVATGEEVFP